MDILKKLGGQKREVLKGGAGICISLAFGTTQVGNHPPKSVSKLHLSSFSAT